MPRSAREAARASVAPRPAERVVELCDAAAQVRNGTWLYDLDAACADPLKPFNKEELELHRLKVCVECA